MNDNHWRFFRSAKRFARLSKSSPGGGTGFLWSPDLVTASDVLTVVCVVCVVCELLSIATLAFSGSFVRSSS